MQPKAILLAFSASLALAAPAVASGGIWCEGDGVTVEIATGRLPVLQVIGAYVEVDGAAFSTGPERGEGTPFVVGQAFSDSDGVKVDFVDPNFETILVSIRLVRDNDADWPLTGHALIGEASHDIRCGAD